MADFLLGYVSDLQLSNVWVVEQRHRAAMGFAQDDWKVNAKLTLNLGLRYDFITPALEASNRQTNFDPAGGGRSCSRATARSRIAASSSRTATTSRRGSASSTSSTTRPSLRGGWGIFYNLFDRVGSEDQLALNVPGLVNNSSRRRPGAPVFFLKQGIPAELPDAAEPRIRPTASCKSAAHPRGQPRRAEDDHQPGQRRACSASSAHGMIADGRLRLHARIQPGVAREPESAAAERGRQQRARARCRIRTSASSSGAPRTASPKYKGIDSGSRSASRSGYAFGVSLHAGRLEGQHVRAADDPGVERVPAELRATSARGTDRATTTFATA